MDEDLQVALLVIDTLEDLGVACFLGGSLASTLYGKPRSTLDADLVADLREEHAEPLFAALRDQFYLDLPAVRAAIEQHANFNVIHLATAFKVDVFIPKLRSYDRLQLRRVARHTVDPETKRTAPFCTAEDIILAKLEWYRLGGEISDRQWQDILGVFKVQGQSSLDLDYLKSWADQLHLRDLFDRAFEEAAHQ